VVKVIKEIHYKLQTIGYECKYQSATSLHIGASQKRIKTKKPLKSAAFLFWINQD